MRSLPTSVATDLLLAGLLVIPELARLHKQLPAAQDNRRHVSLHLLQQATTKPRAKATAGCVDAIINSFEQRRNGEGLSFAVTFL